MPPDLLDPSLAVFLRDVVAGLSRESKSIPCKYFYDARGSELFDEITRLDEYYPTRAELEILERRAPEIARALGAGVALIELGSGSSYKTRILLDEMDELAAYVPVDISEEYLLATADELRDDYPDLVVCPVAADYTRDYGLPELPRDARKVVFFPGSTIGNFDPDEARAFLRRAARLVGPRGGLLIGVDLPKDRAILERAYDDEAGITAEFNRNLLHRIRHELDGDVDPEAFDHRAVWNEEASRMEIYLVSRATQQISVAGHRFELEAGEAIHTESSYKYSEHEFERLAGAAGFRRVVSWRDERDLFSVQYLVIE